MYSGHRRPDGYSRLEIAFMLVLALFVGLLAVTKYLEVSVDAKEAMEPGLIAGVREGIAAYAEESKERGNSILYPLFLDDAKPGAATTRNLFFGRVLERGLAVTGWSKLAENQYQTPSGKKMVYYPRTGEFLLEQDDTAIDPKTQSITNDVNPVE